MKVPGPVELQVPKREQLFVPLVQLLTAAKKNKKKLKCFTIRREKARKEEEAEERKLRVEHVEPL